MRGSGDAQSESTSAFVTLLQTVTPNIVRRRIGVKISIVLLVFAVPLGLVGVVVAFSVAEDIDETTESEFALDAERQAAVVEQWQRGHTTTVQTLSTTDRYAGNLSNGPLEASNGGGTGLHVIEVQEDDVLVRGSSDGDVQASVEGGDDVSVAALSGREWLETDSGLYEPVSSLSQSDVYVSDVYDADGTHVAAFVTPVSETTDRYLITEVRLQRVEAAFRGAGTDDDGFTQVVNPSPHFGDGLENLVMADGRPSSGDVLRLYADGANQLSPVETAQTGESGAVTEMPANERVMDESYVVGYAPISDTDWVVVTHEPRTEMLQTADWLETWTPIGAGSAVLLVALVGGVLGRNISVSVARLNTSAEQLVSGDLNTQFYSPRVDAVGALCGTLVQLRENIRPAAETETTPAETAENTTAESTPEDAQLKQTDTETAQNTDTPADSPNASADSPNVSSPNQSAAETDSEAGFEWVGDEKSDKDAKSDEGSKDDEGSKNDKDAKSDERI